MSHLVLLVEGYAEEALLQNLLPRVLPATLSWQVFRFEGKQDLEKQLPLKLRAWRRPDTRFVVLRDQDSADCLEVKRRLLEKCQASGRADAMVRIACHELESWYLGDLTAVDKANPVEELQRLCPEYQKLSGSREIGKYLDPSGERNRFLLVTEEPGGRFPPRRRAFQSSRSGSELDPVEPETRLAQGRLLGRDLQPFHPPPIEPALRFVPAAVPGSGLGEAGQR